jgi:hypothetical protein
MSVGLVNTGLQFPDGTTQTTAISNTAITGTALTFTATETFVGSATSSAIKVINGLESANVLSSAPTSEQNIYVSNGSVVFFNSNATTNWIPNITFSPSTSLNSLMSVNDSLTIAILTKQGTTAYYASGLKIDGVSQSQFPQGGSLWTYGNSSGIDVYTYTIIKTASATYTVLSAQTQY